MTKAWLMVAVTVVTNFIGVGFVFYSFGVFLKPMTEEFGSGRLGVSMIPMAMGVVGAIFAPLLGRWVGRGRIRSIMSLGAAATGVGFLAASQAAELWHLIVLFGCVITFGYHTLGGFAPQALIVNWFHDNPARALGISLLGTSFAGVVIPNLTTWLVEEGGWRLACEVFGWAALAAAPALWLLVKTHPPSTIESRRDVDTAEAETSPMLTTHELIREPRIWIIATAGAIAFAGGTALTTHLIPYATDRSFSAAQAAWTVSALALGSAVAKLTVGWVVGRIGERVSFQLFLLLQAVATLGLIFDAPYSFLFMISLVVGFGLGTNDALLAALTTKVFGRNSFGPALGLMMSLVLVVGMAGTPAAAWVFDVMGNYDLAWIGFAVSFLVASLVLGRVTPLPSQDSNPRYEAAVSRASGVEF